MTLKVYIFILSQFLLIEKISSGGDNGCDDECDQIDTLVQTRTPKFNGILNSARDDISNAKKVIRGVLGSSAYRKAEALAQEKRDDWKRLLAEITYDSNNDENKEAMEEALSGIQDKIDELSAISDEFGNLKKADCSQCDGVQGILNISNWYINEVQSQLDILKNIVEHTTSI